MSRSSKLPLTRSAGIAARWPLGLALTSWRYLWRTTPFHRAEEAGCWADDGPPPLPDRGTDDDAQRVADGVGPLFHRRYRADIRGAGLPRKS